MIAVCSWPNDIQPQFDPFKALHILTTKTSQVNSPDFVEFVSVKQLWLSLMVDIHMLHDHSADTCKKTLFHFKWKGLISFVFFISRMVMEFLLLLPLQQSLFTSNKTVITIVGVFGADSVNGLAFVAVWWFDVFALHRIEHWSGVWFRVMPWCWLVLDKTKFVWFDCGGAVLCNMMTLAFVMRNHYKLESSYSTSP